MRDGQFYIYNSLVIFVYYYHILAAVSGSVMVLFM